ncbi:hypothetical protein YTCETSXE_CDS0064 [Staphylococcus phage MVC_VPHSA2]|uniref:Uncharacterized protein n=1 Tax=Staphylococcus phage MVC_VPHSA1 TaxID=3088876 RepID=A0ABZ0QZY2_9CAUD|nr:hypothetical protein FBHYGVHD_CDS0070 [Staphylococcus phage MVC_VPHSA1]WPF65020.1 hypothetical protein YTCETSXE_CDS0064 [Staphylococcus phage MVC_VPHSA2]
MNNRKYGWKIDFDVHQKGTVLFGANFNTNDHFGGQRESYVCLYLFKVTVIIGKFH